MSRWTHAQCPTCWVKVRGQAMPLTMRDAPLERCCWCGDLTRQGIYIRHDPAALRCCGVHGEVR